MCLQSLTLKGCRFMVTLSGSVKGKGCKMAQDGETTLSPQNASLKFLPIGWSECGEDISRDPLALLKTSLMPEVTHPGKYLAHSLGGGRG